MATRRRTASEWARVLEDWQRSGLSKDAYAGLLGVSPVTLGWWRWKLGASEAVPHPAPTGFAEVVVLDRFAEVPAPDLVVELGALRVRVPPGFDAGELRRVLDALC